jgi:hypothetical protein
VGIDDVDKFSLFWPRKEGCIECLISYGAGNLLNDYVRKRTMLLEVSKCCNRFSNVT